MRPMTLTLGDLKAFVQRGANAQKAIDKLLDKTTKKKRRPDCWETDQAGGKPAQDDPLGTRPA